MNSFKDTVGRDWIVTVNYLTIERVQQMEDFNLLKMVDPSAGEAGTLGPVKLARVLYSLCKDQADSLKLTYNDFALAFSMDAAESAIQALQEGLINFYPSRLRQPLTTLKSKMEALQAAALTKATAAIDSLDVEKILQGLSGDAASKPLESSGSTSGPTPSAIS